MDNLDELKAKLVRAIEKRGYKVTQTKNHFIAQKGTRTYKSTTIDTLADLVEANKPTKLRNAKLRALQNSQS